MLDNIKQILRKNNSLFILTLDKNTDTIILTIPENKMNDWPLSYVFYKISDNGVSFSIDNENREEMPTPAYARRTLLLTDVGTVCKKWGFDSTLIEFKDGNDIIDESAFFSRMLPKEIVLSEEDRAKEYSLVNIVQKASTALIPFSAEHLLEAQQKDVELGFSNIVSIALLGE